MRDGDEIVICNDASTDNTAAIITELSRSISNIRIVSHWHNRGGAAARNTAIDTCRHDLLFCLDSDNLLAPNSVDTLRKHMQTMGAEAAAFGEVHYFNTKPAMVTHKAVYPQVTDLSNYMTGPVCPGASGNYLFTRDSYNKAGGYPEFAHALDTWGFGLRQVATGTSIVSLPGTYYNHRYGNDSYWTRFSRSSAVSLIALQVLLPFIDELDAESREYVLSTEGRTSWLNNLSQRPVRAMAVSQTEKGEVQSTITLKTRFFLKLWRLHRILRNAFKRA